MDTHGYATLAGETLREAVETVGVEDNQVTHAKDSKYSYVTETDKALDEFLSRELEERTDIPVLSEERDFVPNSDEYWTVDPIDGTIPFAHGLPNYVSMAALVRDEVPVASAIYVPETDDLHTASGDKAYKNGVEINTSDEPLDSSATFCSIRDGGAYKDEDFVQLHNMLAETGLVFGVFCAGYSATIVAEGGATAAVYVKLNKWDYMPVVPLIESAGGVIGSLETSETGVEVLNQNDGTHVCFASSEHVFDECVALYQQAKSNDNP